MKKFFTLFLILLSTVTYGQIISGKVVDDLNQPLPFVTIIVEGTNIGTTSDIDGNYSLKLPKPESNIIFKFIGYQEQKIKSNGGEHNILMKSSSIEIKEIEIVDVRDKRDETILILDKKNLVGLESSIGNLELSKKGISNAEDGLKKLAGITFTNNRLNIRGLDDRYNQVTLNGLPLASNNSDKKNLDLVLLPTSLLDNIKVKKTYSSEQWSNVGGAQINLNSPDIRDVFSITLRNSFNTLTPYPSTNFNIQYGLVKNRFGVLLNLNFINDWQNTSGVIRMVNKQGNSVLDYQFKDVTTQYTPSGLLVLSYDLKGLQFKNTSMFIGQFGNSDRQTYGTHFDYSNEILTTRKTPTEHILITNQFETKWKKDEWYLDGIAGFGYVTSGERGREQFVYLYDGNYRFNNIDKLDNHTLWSKNEEYRTNLNVTSGWKNQKMNHEIGYSFQYSQNIFDYQQRYYDLGKINSNFTNINPSTPYQYFVDTLLTELWVNNPASKVTGSVLINGGYLKSTINLNKIDLSGGVRIEYIEQLVQYRDQLSPVFLKENRLKNVDILPYLNLKYKINDKFQLKSNTSITTIRPRFREMVPFIYTEVFAGSKIQGNPKLINSTVYNTDITFEYYPDKDGLISITAFGKIIQNPIERVNVATASGRLETFQNTDNAFVLGSEIELKKKIYKFTFDLNFTYLWSQISISENSSSTVVVTNKQRPLQGSTPFLFNLDVFYSITKEHSLGLTYNFVGDKLNSVGIFGLGDVYQSNQHFLNFIYNMEIKSFNLSFRVNNIINSPFELRQQSDKGNVVINNFNTGQEFVLSLKYKLK